MNKYKIIFTSLIVLIFTIGVVSAMEITDLNAPAGFEKNSLTFTHDDFEMNMKGYALLWDYDNNFEKSDGREVNIINKTYAEYIDSTEGKVGALEIIKIDGEYYLVDCFYDGLDKNKTKDCTNYLKEFNDANTFFLMKIDNSF